MPDRSSRIADLVRQAKDGREEALGQLVTELSPLLWHVARAAGLSTGDAEDVVQTVWLRLVSHLDQIRSSSALTAWLVTTAKREAWRVRAAGRKQVLVDDSLLTELPDDLKPDPQEQAIAADDRRCLWAALGQLTPRCRELLRIIAFVPRPDYQAVANELGIPRGSVGPTRGRCLAKLRRLLGGEPGESVEPGESGEPMSRTMMTGNESGSER